MLHTFDKLKINDLIALYEKLQIKLDMYTPDMPEYEIIEKKLDSIESIIQDKKPTYFFGQEQKEDKAFIDNILTENYDISYVAMLLNVTRQTIHNWVKQGKIKVIKVGRKPYISKSEIEKIIHDGF